VKFGRDRGIPVALDVRDLWPDVFFDLVPTALRPVARHAVPWMTAQLRRSATGADAILGVTDAFVDWGTAAGRRPRTARDRAFPMGYSERMPSADQLRQAGEFWDRHGIVEKGSQPVVCFFGTFGWMFDFETVLKAAAIVNQAGSGARFVLCGGGERLEQLRQAASGLDNVLFPGFVGSAEIWTLMRRSVAGLAPYRDFRNFDDNLPNKPIEYLSAGLPIVASQVRVLARLIHDHGCGLTYAHGDSAALATAVRAMGEDAGRQRSMAGRARALFEQRYIAERVYDEMARHLEGLATIRQGASAIISG
jgi:glycosyltransferase involved in cell wall biosynthesis